jgi:large subunit ribosomal protein L24
MIKSGKPRKQRLFRFQAPLHLRQHFVNSRIDKKIKERLSLKRRSIPVVVGDTVKVLAGSHRGKEGKVASVSLRKAKITIESIKRKDSKGKEHNIAISPSNVCITDLNLSDKFRAAKLKVTVQPQQKQAKVEKPAAEEKPAAATPTAQTTTKTAVPAVKDLKQIKT